MRAAFTRTAIRDFYDLAELHAAGLDMNSPEFRKLVDLKLAELEALPLGDQARPLGLTPTRRSELRSSLLRELPGVLRRDAPAFDFEQTVTTLDALWAQSSKLP